MLDFEKNVNNYPHLVILGAGASKACCPNDDKNGKTLPVMNDLIDILELNELLKKHGYNVTEKNFEKMYSIIYKDNNENLLKEIEYRVRNYFSKLEISDKVTIYDLLISFLRKKDVIVSFNWDPLLIQAFKRNHFHSNMPNMIFLHGNVELGVCYQCKNINYINLSCGICGKDLTPSKLLFPIINKNYTKDPYIKNNWELLKDYIEKAYFITIFGYSAPDTDVEAINIMNNIWNENNLKDMAEIEIIDIKSEKELHETWNDFIVRSHFSTKKTFYESWLCQHPRRTCEAHSSIYMMNDPKWEIQNFQKAKNINSLHKLKKIINPLIKEENEYDNTDKKFDPKRQLF